MQFTRLLSVAVFVAAFAAVVSATVETPEKLPRISRRSADRGEVLARTMFARQALPLPSVDPFYNYTGDLNSKQPGDILNTRRVSSSSYSFTFNGQLIDLNQNVESATQVLIRSTDQFGAPSTTVATVIIPHNALSNPRRVLVFQSAENSASKDCATSYKLTKGSGRGDYDVAIELVFANRELGQGYILVFTDYEGPKAGFSVGKLAAQGVLDGARGGLKQIGVDLNSGSQRDARLAFFGYSGGALATSWAVQNQADYAPDLSKFIVGASYGGIPVNPKNTFLLLNKQQAAGVAFAGLAGTGNIFPDFNAYLNQHATKNGTERLIQFRYTPGYCLVDAVNALQFQDVFSYFDQPQDTVLNTPVIADALAKNTLGSSQFNPRKAPAFPVRIHQAMIDEIVPTADVDNYVNNEICKNNWNVLYVKELVGEHQSLAITGSPAAFAWLDDRFAGKNANLNGCQFQTTASSLISWQAYLVFGQSLLNQLLAIYNAPLGPLSLFGEKKVGSNNGSVQRVSPSIVNSLSSSAAVSGTSSASAPNATNTAATKPVSNATQPAQTSNKPWWQRFVPSWLQ
ncbi:Lipase, secreted [Ceraceosorus bombacis]|uniref:triacylglycerol lipase n=1 Tax=Ceraceosorus bombacis TaxID=401625 RepID=A0A0P1B8S0_9BASI|nr:Lipase, secreted [Ceraceosorus bombacis]